MRGVPSATATATAGELPAATRTAVRRALLAWYRRHARDLPWRRTHAPYAVWLSEIMLQQTRVETVIPYYERFLAAFPTVADFARAPQARVLKLWEGLGYYSRARNLHKAAQVIAHERGGVFPTTAAEWQTLPGVGRYTANAIASITRGEVVAVVDGNVKRVLARLCALDSPIDRPATVTRLWDLATQLVAPRSPGDFNQALMELGARICTPRGPKCMACPLRAPCAAFAMGRTEELPRKSAKRAVPRVQASAAFVEWGDCVLLVQRPSRGLLAGLWTLPTVEHAATADGPAALTAYLRDVLGVKVRIGECCGTVQHQFTHRHLIVDVYAAELAASRGDEGPPVNLPAQWVSRDELERYPRATVDRKLFAAFEG